MAGIIGYAGSFGLNEKPLNEVVSKIKSPYTDNEVVKLRLCNAYVAIVIPKGRGLYSYRLSDDGVAVLYGYIYPDSVKELVLRDVGSFRKQIAGVLSRVDGSFTIVLASNDAVRTVTDKFGTRPMYYSFFGGGVLFGTRINPMVTLLKYTGKSVKLDEEAVVSYLWFGNRIGILGDNTFVKNIYLAPAASILNINTRTGRIEKIEYWRPRIESKEQEEAPIRDLARGLTSSILKLLKIAEERGLKRVCLMLSGGLDSRAIAAALSLYRGKLEIFSITMGTKKCDEIPIASRVAEISRLKHHVITYKLEDLADYAIYHVRFTDTFTPINNISATFLADYISKLRCDAVIVGFLLDAMLQGHFLVRAHALRRYLNFLYKRSSVFNHEEMLHLLQRPLKKLLPRILRNFVGAALNVNGKDPVVKSYLFDLATRQRRLICYGLECLRESGEVLIPAVFEDFYRGAFTLVRDIRGLNIRAKLVTTLNAKLSLIPYQGTLIPPIMPTMCQKLGYLIKKLSQMMYKLTKDRMGYEPTYFDLDKALRESPKWRGLLRLLFNDDCLIYKSGIVNKDFVIKLVREHLTGTKNHGEKLGVLISLEVFLRNLDL